MASWRVWSPPAPAMRSGFRFATAVWITSMPVRCAPSAPPRPTISGGRRARSAAPFFCTTGASALTRLISAPSLASASRSSTAAMSATSTNRQAHRAMAAASVDRRRDEIEARRAGRDRARAGPGPCCLECDANSGGKGANPFIAAANAAKRLSRLLFQVLPSTGRARRGRSCGARCAKARCAAATFSALPDQAFCGAACSARP